MQKSESIKNIAAALVLFHMKVDKIKKDSKNDYIGNSYASLSHILESIQVPLSESGLSYSQLPTGTHGLITILMHAESGEYLEAEYDMAPIKGDPQSKGSAITYQRRYALQAVLGLNIEEDDDGNKGSAGGKGSNNAPSPSELPWLNDSQFDGAVKKLKAGTTTIAKIKTVMRVSKAMEAKLIEASKA